MGALKYIDQSLVGFIPSGPEFEKLVSDTLGNAADPSDGFDADLAAVVNGVSATDALLDATDIAFGDVLAASAVFDSIDTAGLVEDFNQGAPVIDAFSYNLQLKTVASLKVPPAAPPPTGGPPVQVCLPAPPAPTPQPAPAPAPQPAPAPCAPGQSFLAGACVTPGPTPAPIHLPPPVPPILVQTPGPCAEGFILNPDGICGPAAPPPAPAPCPPGEHLLSTGDCAPTPPPVDTTPPPIIPPPVPIICGPGWAVSHFLGNPCEPCDPLSSILDPLGDASQGCLPSGSQAAPGACDQWAPGIGCPGGSTGDFNPQNPSTI